MNTKYVVIIQCDIAHNVTVVVSVKKSVRRIILKWLITSLHGRNIAPGVLPVSIGVRWMLLN